MSQGVLLYVRAFDDLWIAYRRCEQAETALHAAYRHGGKVGPTAAARVDLAETLARLIECAQAAREEVAG